MLFVYLFFLNHTESLVKGKTRAKSDNEALGLDCESVERATRNCLPDKSYPVESSSSGKRKQLNADSADESDQETDNSYSDIWESSDNDTLFDPSESLKKGIKVLAKITKCIEKYANQFITKNLRF